MSAIANPRLLCNECESDFENATLSKSPDEITAAIENIGKKLVDANNDDELVLKTVTEIIEDAAERCELIKNGVYDFDNDKVDDVEEGEIPEELQETEEDRELDRKEEEARKKTDKFMNYVTIGALIAALGFIIYRIITRFL